MSKIIEWSIKCGTCDLHKTMIVLAESKENPVADFSKRFGELSEQHSHGVVTASVRANLRV